MYEASSKKQFVCLIVYRKYTEGNFWIHKLLFNVWDQQLAKTPRCTQIIVTLKLLQIRNVVVIRVYFYRNLKKVAVRYVFCRDNHI